MLDTPSIILLLTAALAAGVATYLGLFRPPVVPTIGRDPGEPARPSPAGAQVYFVGAFVVYCSWMLAGLLVQAFAGPITGGSGDPPSPSLELAARTQGLMLLLAVPAAIVIYWWVHRHSSQSVRVRIGALAKTLKVACLWAFVAIPLVFAIGMAAKRVSESLGQPVDKTAHSTLKMIVDDKGPLLYRVVLIACAVIGAPILEEICYRGFLQRGLSAFTRSHWAGVLLTSILFTAMHVGVIPSGSFWPAAAMLFSLSVMLGLLLARTRSVVTTIVIHGLFNAANIVMALSSQWNNP